VSRFWGILLLLAFGFAHLSCEDDTAEPLPLVPLSSPVVFNLGEVPYNSLSSYAFFEGELVNQSPAYGVLPYEVITPLFSDYAHKYRFIWMPSGAEAQYVSDDKVLDFDDGTVMIKTFFYERVLPADQKRLMETRLEYKKDGEWKFAEYIWNDEQTEAFLDSTGSFRFTEFIDDEGIQREVNYRFPSSAECFTCHKKNDIGLPIGPKPQNLDQDYPYAEGTQNQLDKLIDFGYLADGLPVEIDRVADWTDLSESITDRVRAYVDMNCAHCHREGSHCDYRPMRFAWSETSAEENLGVCIEPDEELTGESQLTHIVSRGIPDRSMMFYRISTTLESRRMPLLGRSVNHDEGIALIQEWIESLEPTCQ